MDSGPLRLSNFLVNARAQQARERNKRTGNKTMMLVYKLIMMIMIIIIMRIVVMDERV